MSEEQDGREARIVRVGRQTRDIFNGGLLFKVLKKAVDEDGNLRATNQGVASGQRAHLMDKLAARELRDLNAVHASCLDAKVSSSVGMGHRDEEIHEVLDPLCTFSWQDVLNALAEDYWETGECFLEVVRDPNDLDLVRALNHVESAQCYVEVEEEGNQRDFHYVVNGETAAGQTTVMARFGDLANLQKRLGSATSSSGSVVPSEIIHFRQGGNRSRWYSLPDYMSAVPSIELVQCMTQHEFDFYFNRGVPEFLLFLIGANLNTKSWEKIEDLIKASQGLGNSHKTGAVQIPHSPQDLLVQVEKLAMEDAGNSGFSEKSTSLDMRIATAHGVPPILANILLPGKIGAANEGPNALLLFQKRKLGQAQRNFSTMLARTLGAPETVLAQPEGTAKLTAEQFLGKTGKPKPNPMDPQSAMGTTDENGMPIFAQPGNGFKTVLDGMTLGAQDTLARMKEPLASSARNPEDGLLDGADDRKPADPRRTR